MQVHTAADSDRRQQLPAALPDAFAELIAEASASRWLQVSPADAMREIDAGRPFVLDVRDRNEWDESGHIADAVRVPVTDLADNLDKLPADADAPILVYCAAGTRALYGALYLKLLGYANVRNIAGGLGAWSSGGLPVAR